MNKKILIGCIIGVTILVGVSFTSVVSYSSVKTASTLNSPLFGIRTSRAVNKESKDLRCYYFGKGEETDISLSSRMNIAEQSHKVIDIISKMSDKAFSRFVARIMLNLKYQGQKDKSDVLQALFYIRKNPNIIRRLK